MTLAALLNALKIVKKDPGELKIVFNGVGASGVATTRSYMDAGVRNIIGCDTAGAIYEGRTENMNFMKEWYAEHTNPEGKKGPSGRSSKEPMSLSGCQGRTLSRSRWYAK